MTSPVFQKKLLNLGVVLLAAVFILQFPIPVWADEDGAGEAAKEYLRRELPRLGEGVSVDALVGDLNTGEVLFEIGGRRPLVPASVLKLVTTFAALKTLGSEYTFPTEVFVPAAASSGRSTGDLAPERRGDDLYIRGHGDPSFKNQDATLLAEQLAARGIVNVKNLIIDSSLFIDPPPARGSNPYQAAQSAVSINNNCYLVTVAPGRSYGRFDAGKKIPALIALTPGAQFSLLNHAVTVSSANAEDPVQIIQTPGSESFQPRPQGGGVTRPFQTPQIAILVKGSIEYGSQAREFYQTVPDPSSYYATLLKYRLEQAGIKVTGQVQSGVVPQNAEPFFTFNSQSLVPILNDLNHYSLNFTAGQILYALGKGDDGVYRRDDGIKRLRLVLKNLGIPADQYNIVDGSGLDPANRISAEALHQVLYAAARDQSISPDFFSSLGRFGHTGTVRKRHLAEASTGGEVSDRFNPGDSVWAKTGTLDKVSSLAGIVETSGRRRLTFVILSNGSFDPVQIKNFEDGLVAVLLKD